MISRLLTKLDRLLLSGQQQAKLSSGESLDVIQLEDRILYSVSPLPQDPGLADFGNDGALPEMDSIGEASSLLAENNTESTASSSDLSVMSEAGLGQLTEFSTEPSVSREIVLLDENVENLDQLVQDLLSTADPSRDIELVILSDNDDGIDQISRALQGRTDIDAVHLFVHGAEGQLQIGNGIVTTDDLPGYAGQILGWRDSLSDHADILLYGCDLANAGGQEWIESLAVLCDCDVAASDDLTGHAELGGDWEFEYTVGAVESQVAFSQQLQSSWFSTLDITSNLVAHYEFEENGGVTATDTTAHSNDGALSNSPTWNTDSAVGTYALDFTGDSVSANRVVTVPDDASLNFDGDFTVAFWYNSSTSPSSNTRLVGSHDGDDGFSIFTNSDGSLNFYVEGDDGANTASLSGGLIADGNWHHVTARRTGNDIELRLNENAGVATASGLIGALDVSAPITIGGETVSGPDYEGLLDDVRIYTRHLSTSDISELYALGSATGTPQDLLATSTSDGGLSLNDDGGNDIYLQADSSPFNGQTATTIEVEFSADNAASGVTTLFSYADGSNRDELFFGVDATGELFFRTSSDSGPGYGSITKASQLFDGDRHTVAVTWENGDGVLKFYVDGEELGLGRNDYQKATAIDSGGIVVLGQHQGALGSTFESNDTFSGTLHRVRVFDNARSDSEIASSYRSELPHTESGMLAQWNFDSLSTNDVVVESVSGNNLTLQHTAESGFTASAAALTLSVDENALDSTVVGQLAGIDAQRSALVASLLAADSNLRYSAETGKFYKLVSANVNWATANSTALATSLEGVAGQLGTIRSAAEQELFTGFFTELSDQILLGGSDSEVEGEWRWNSGGSEADLFWSSGLTGYAPNNAFSNWIGAQPDNSGGEDQLAVWNAGGGWNDIFSSFQASYVVEWNADDVLDVNQALTYSFTTETVAGAFTIDSDSGQIRVADGSLLDFETNASHSLTVRATDVNSNTYDKVVNISLNDLVESSNAPSNLSSGIELNLDGGNDAYLEAANGSSILGGLTEVTFETRFQTTGGEDTPALISYATAAEDNEFAVYAGVSTGNVFVNVGGNHVDTGYSFSNIEVDTLHTVSVTWSNNGGNWELFVDGDQVAHGTGLSDGHTISSGGTLVFGNEQDSLGGDFSLSQELTGTLYDIRIWNSVRSEAEIALNYQHKLDSSNLPSDLIANWQMDGFNGSNQVVDVVSESTTPNRLSIGHASGSGFTASTPVEDLHVAENASNGTSVGFVVPTDQDTPKDIVSDGRFLKEPFPGSHHIYFGGETIGDWIVRSGSVDLIGSRSEESPLGGASIDLDGNVARGEIYQALSTTEGTRYQVLFALSGNWSGGEDVKQLRVSVAGESRDFSITEPPGWSDSNMLWESRSFTFTADSASTELNFQSLSDAASSFGAVISDVRVLEFPDAVTTILNNDSALSYDAATGKFYKVVTAATDVTTALSNARGDQLNGV